MRERRFCLLSLLGGAFFSFCTIIGAAYAPAGQKIAFIEPEEWLMYLPFFVVLTIFFYFILYKILHHQYRLQPTSPVSRPAVLFCRHPFWVSFCIILIVWIPFFIVYYPGNVSLSAMGQINMSLGYSAMTNKHPVFSTLLLGWIFSLGKVVNDNFGVFCVVLVQSLLCAAAFALCVCKILQMTKRIGFGVGALAFFALNPTWAYLREALIKDTPYFICFLFFTICFIDAAVVLLDRGNEQPYGKGKCVLLAALGILCCQLRHGEIIIIGTALIFLAIFALREKMKMIIVFAATVVLAIGINRVMVTALDAGSAPTRATYSVFFQQTARYMKMYPDDVTQEEYEAIDAVLSADRIGRKYKPLLSDPVKNTYKDGVGSKEMKAYFKAWFQMFLRHPKTYFDSFFQFSYGYLDPFQRTSVHSDFLTYISHKYQNKEIDIEYVMPEKAQELVNKYSDLFVRIPVIKLISNPGTYIWIWIVCFLLLWKKRCRRQMAVFILPALRSLLCLASPLAGSIRYSAPVMVITPIMIAYTYRTLARKAELSDGSLKETEENTQLQSLPET